MALVPIIQPPIMKFFTTEQERRIKMEQLRPVSKLEKILFPIIVTIVVCLILPSTAPLVGMLMLGNLFKESGVVGQLAETASNAMMYIVVILLGTSVGATTSAEAFLNWNTVLIVLLGLVAFAVGTESWFRGRPHQFPVDACYGAQCSRCYRHRSGSWYFHGYFWSKIEPSNIGKANKQEYSGGNIHGRVWKETSKDCGNGSP